MLPDYENGAKIQIKFLNFRRNTIESIKFLFMKYCDKQNLNALKVTKTAQEAVCFFNLPKKMLSFDFALPVCILQWTAKSRSSM